MRLSDEIIKRVEDKMLETYILAQKVYGRNFDLAKLSFDIDSKRIAGLAFYYQNLIKINPKFLIEFPDQVVNRTVGHEIAHLLTHQLYPYAKQSHGPEWKSVARNLNVPDTRCHSMTLVENLKNGFVYHCPKCLKEFILSPLIHRRVMAGQRRFHRVCKSAIVLKN
jgi:SprT protein